MRCETKKRVIFGIIGGFLLTGLLLLPTEIENYRLNFEDTKGSECIITKRGFPFTAHIELEWHGEGLISISGYDIGTSYYYFSLNFLFSFCSAIIFYVLCEKLLYLCENEKTGSSGDTIFNSRNPK